MSPSQSQKIIPLGRVTRPHGFAREGILRLKVELFSPGGEILREAQEVWVAAGAGAPFRAVKLAAESAPAGGSWGKARGVILAFRESEAPAAQSHIGLPREAFPKLQGEIYLCDLLGRTVRDEQGRAYGVVSGVFTHDGGGVIVEAVPPGGSLAFEFPFEWVRDFNENALDLTVPGVEAWARIDDDTSEPDHD